MNRIKITIIIFALSPVLVFAHGSHGSGFMSGFTHPIFGLDHCLAILGIGTLSHLLDSKKWYLYPISFLIPMIIGGIIGIDQDATRVIEKVIALSVFSIGFCHLRKINTGNFIILILLGVFGFFHGYAHGAEMPETTTTLKYITGYSVGTIMLSILGNYSSKLFLTNSSKSQYYTLVSGLLMGAGLVFLWP